MAKKKKSTQQWHIFGKKFTAPIKRKYKSDSRYLSRIYQLNKEAIDEAYDGTEAGPKETFKEKVKRFMEKDKTLSISQAVRKTFKTTSFVSEDERTSATIEKFMKGQKQTFKAKIGLKKKRKARL